MADEGNSAWENWRENLQNPSMHDAVMIGVLTNIFLVFVLVFVLFFAMNIANVGARPDATKVNDTHTLFVGHPASEEAGCSIKCGDLPTTGSRKLYSFYVQGPDGKANILAEYDNTQVPFVDQCLYDANLDIYLYDENGNRIDNGEMSRCEGGSEGKSYTGLDSGIYTIEVVGTHGTAIEYEIEVIAS